MKSPGQIAITGQTTTPWLREDAQPQKNCTIIRPVMQEAASSPVITCPVLSPKPACIPLCQHSRTCRGRTAAPVGAECRVFTSADQGLQHFIYGSTQMLATQVSRVDKSCVIEELRSQGSFQRFLRHNTVAIDAFKYVEVVPFVRRKTIATVQKVLEGHLAFLDLSGTF